MKLQVLQENLSQALSCVIRSVSTKPSLPILANILLETLGQGKLKLSATNLETTIEFSLPAKIEEEGLIVCPAKIISDFVLNLPNSKVNLEEKGSSLTISCQDFQANINTVSAVDFPRLNSVLPEKTLSLSPKIFKAQLQKVSLAAAQDEGRPALTGVLFWLAGKILTLVATDGYRLSLLALPLREKTEKDFRVIIPARSLIEVSYIVAELAKSDKKAKDEEEVLFYLLEKENQAVFSYKGVQLSTRLIEGEFPNYDKIIPQTFTTRANLLREDLVRAVKVASLFVRDSSGIIKLKLDAEGKIVATANSKEIGGGQNRSGRQDRWARV